MIAEYTCGIVEDEELARKILLRYIKRHPRLRVAWVLDSLSRESPQDLRPDIDILFLDLLDSPHDASGISRDVRIAPSQYEHIVITTAYTLPYVQQQGIRFSKLLHKPFTYAMFEQVVDELLEQLPARPVLG